MNQYKQQNAGLVTPVSTTESNTRIRDSVTDLEIQVSSLHALISLLEARLETVITPRPPQVMDVVPEKSGPSGPPMSHVCDRVCSLNNAVKEAQVRLQQLLSGIEL